MTTQAVPSHENVFNRPDRALSLRGRIIETLLEWRRRMTSRSELAALSELELRDLGYPARADAEKAKPFWRV